MPTDLWNVLAAIAEAIGATAAIVALFVALHTQKQQNKLTKAIHEQQIALQQRQIVLPLWEQVEKLSDINPDAPVWVDVRGNCHVLELVAICWEGHLIDRDIIRRLLADMVIDLYEKIDLCRDPPKGEPDGRALLRQCPATQKMYKELKHEYLVRNQLQAHSPQKG